MVTSAIENLIRENKGYRIPSSIQTGKKFGMQLLDEHLFKLFAEGKISAENTRDYAQSPAVVMEKIEGFQKGQIGMPGEQIDPDKPQAAE